MTIRETERERERERERGRERGSETEGVDLRFQYHCPNVPWSWYLRACQQSLSPPWAAVAQATQTSQPGTDEAAGSEVLALNRDHQQSYTQCGVEEHWIGVSF